MLAEKWPSRYNPGGHLSWRGRIYGPGLTACLLAGKPRVYHGVWGRAPFQKLYQPQAGTFRAPIGRPPGVKLDEPRG